MPCESSPFSVCNMSVGIPAVCSREERAYSGQMKSDTEHYDYPLPRELIAEQPLAQRTDARLLVVNREQQSLEHRHVRDLPELLRPSDCLVINDTRVVPARIVGHRAQTGGRWEGLF